MPNDLICQYFAVDQRLPIRKLSSSYYNTYNRALVPHNMVTTDITIDRVEFSDITAPYVPVFSTVCCFETFCLQFRLQPQIFLVSRPKVCQTFSMTPHRKRAYFDTRWRCRKDKADSCLAATVCCCTEEGTSHTRHRRCCADTRRRDVRRSSRTLCRAGCTSICTTTTTIIITIIIMVDVYAIKMITHQSIIH